MTNDEKSTKIKEALKDQDLYLVKDVMDINHRPHQYTIGPAHIGYASDHHSGMLDMETIKNVKCAYPNCNIPYEDHTSDNVCFLQLKSNGTNDEASTILKKLVTDLGESFVDGFAFVDTDEKFRIIKES